MPTYHNRRDGNQSEVEQALVAAGWSVIPTNLMRGKMLDLLVAKQGVTIAVEIKMPGEKLTESELNFFHTWPGQKTIVTSGQEAVDKASSILNHWNR